MVSNGRKEENRGELVKRIAQDIWDQGSLAWPPSFRLRKDSHGDGYVWRKRVSDGGAQAQERRLVIYTSNKVFCQGGDERVEGELRAVNHEMTGESLRDCDWPVRLMVVVKGK